MSNPKSRFPAAKFTVLISIIVGAVFLMYFKKFGFTLGDNKGDWGTFGDFIGGTLNPLLSFLALLVLVLTYFTQSLELDLQREELKETKAILKEQSETQKRQQFENTFFELLKVHNHILDALSHEPQPTTINEQFSGFGNTSRTQKHNSKLQDIIEHISYSEVLILIEANKNLNLTNYLCGHYFRSLYQLLKFIAINSKNEIDETFKGSDIERNDVKANEKMYSNMVRALLPDDVITLLAVNCYCENDKAPYWKFKLLIERYAFFEHASFRLGRRHFEFSEIEKHYLSKAFGK